MPQQSVQQGLLWSQIRAILNSNATDVESRLAQIETGGIQIVSGAGAPGAGTGNVGDFYIDNTGYLVYGPKTEVGWPAPVSMSGFMIKGPWNVATTYTHNDVVTYQNSVWVAMDVSTAVEPRDLANEWQIIARGDYFRGDWVTGTQYRAQHLVKHGGNVYRSQSLEFTSNVDPATDTGNWVLYVPTGVKGDKGDKGDTGDTGATGPRGLNHMGNYASGTTYAIDDAVVYRSKLWRRKTAGSGVEPTTSNTTEWEKIAGSLHYVSAAWSAATDYRVDDLVYYQQQLYRVRTNHTSTATTPDVDTTNYSLFLPKGVKGDTGDTGAQGNVGPQGTPGAGYSAGFIAPYGGTGTPAGGWLQCNGQAVNRTTYADLFAAIGTDWGVGDGSTTFNVPDLRGKTLIDDGNGGAGFTNRVVGQDGGSETHTLTVGQMPSHRHDFAYSQGNNNTGGGGGDRVINLASTGGQTKYTNYEGSGSAHNNMQPFAVVNYLIKT